MKNNKINKIHNRFDIFINQIHIQFKKTNPFIKHATNCLLILCG